MSSWEKIAYGFLNNKTMNEFVRVRGNPEVGDLVWLNGDMVVKCIDNPYGKNDKGHFSYETFDGRKHFNKFFGHGDSENTVIKELLKLNKYDKYFVDKFDCKFRLGICIV